MLSALASLMATESSESRLAVALLAAVTLDTSALISCYLSHMYSDLHINVGKGCVN